MALCIVQRLPFLVGGLFAVWELTSHCRGVFPLQIEAQLFGSPFDIARFDHALRDLTWYAEPCAAVELIIDPAEESAARCWAAAELAFELICEGFNDAHVDLRVTIKPV